MSTKSNTEELKVVAKSLNKKIAAENEIKRWLDHIIATCATAKRTGTPIYKELLPLF